jgi:hypothetical protein
MLTYFPMNPGAWCPKCKKHDPAPRKYCQACGARMPKRSSPILIGCLGFFGIGVVLAIIGPIIGPPKTVGSGPAPAARSPEPPLSVCEPAVSQRLKSPGSAKFSGFFDTRLIKINQAYHIFGWADSQNSFGALLRTRYVCEVKVNSSGWVITNLRLVPR